MGDLLRPVAEFESKNDGCGSYVIVAPLECGEDVAGTAFETYGLSYILYSSTILLMTIFSYDDEGYLQNVHMKSDAVKAFIESVYPTLTTAIALTRTELYRNQILGSEQGRYRNIRQRVVTYGEIKFHPLR